jgi:glucose 1-dehydrogenase
MLAIDLTGRRALITGSSSGLGEAMAHALAQAGAQIAVHDRNKGDACEKVAAVLRDTGVKAEAFGADISSREEVDRLFNDIQNWCGGIDILINNAGMDGSRADCVDGDPIAWEKTIAVDLYGAYYCSRLALKSMLPQGKGVILNITSVHEFIPWDGYSAYTSAKAGLSMMTKTIAQEVADKGVRVLALAPGAIRTPINASVWQDPKGLADLDGKIAMGRMGEPDEIGRVAAFLVSDLASYITGTSVAVDGGMLIYPDFRHGG